MGREIRHLLKYASCNRENAQRIGWLLPGSQGNYRGGAATAVLAFRRRERPTTKLMAIRA